MPAPGGNTFDGNPNTSPPTTSGYRPGITDFNGGALQDDQTYGAPNPATMPTAALLNTYSAMSVVFGRMIPVARISVTGGTAPSISQFVAAPDGLAIFGSATTWLPTTVYALNSFVVAQASTGFYYKATSVSGTGTSGSNANIFVGVTTIGQTVTDNPGSNQIVWTCTGVSTFSVYLVSTGKVQITWPANTFPTPETGPKATLNGILTTGHSYSCSCTGITNGIEIDTLQDTAYANLSFTAEVW